MILKARERGLVEAVYPLLLALRKAGLWLSDALVADVLQQAGEA